MLATWVLWAFWFCSEVATDAATACLLSWLLLIVAVFELLCSVVTVAVWAVLLSFVLFVTFSTWFVACVEVAVVLVVSTLVTCSVVFWETVSASAVLLPIAIIPVKATVASIAKTQFFPALYIL